MFAIFLTVIISFLVSSLFGYVVHRALHQSWAGRLNQKHMTHHLSLYPPTDYLSDKYRKAGQDNTVVIFVIVAIPIIIVPIVLGLLNILSLLLVIISLMIMGLMGFLHNYLHDSFHINRHWLYQNSFTKNLFKRWSLLHLIHHQNMNYNYGIFLFHWDYVFRSFLNAK